MQRDFVAELLNAVAVVLFHQVQAHCVGQRHIEIVRVPIDVAAHHPPGDFERLAKRVLELVSERLRHDLIRHPGGGGEEILLVVGVA